MPSPLATLRASTVPSAARIGPRSTRCCSSSTRALSGLLRSEDASKTVQREVNATSRANSRATSPYRRMIGWFTAGASFQLGEFEAADQRGRVGFRAQRVVEERLTAFGCQRRGADTRYVVAAVERQVARQLVGNTSV